MAAGHVSENAPYRCLKTKTTRKEREKKTSRPFCTNLAQIFSCFFYLRRIQFTVWAYLDPRALPFP